MKIGEQYGLSKYAFGAYKSDLEFFSVSQVSRHWTLASISQNISIPSPLAAMNLSAAAPWSPSCCGLGKESLNYSLPWSFLGMCHSPWAAHTSVCSSSSEEQKHAIWLSRSIWYFLSYCISYCFCDLGTQPVESRTESSGSSWEWMFCHFYLAEKLLLLLIPIPSNQFRFLLTLWK